MADPQAPETAPAAPPTPPQETKKTSVVGKLTDMLVPDVLKHRQNLHTSLERAVDNSASPSVEESSLSQNEHHHWLKDLFDDETLDKLFKKDHAGNFVAIRGTDKTIFETMPLYARIGMHLLFYGSAQVRFLHEGKVRKLLKDQSIKQGKIYDSTDPKIVRPHIESFIKTYKVDLTQLANPDLNSYKTINEFFARRLKPNLRPIASPKDASVITSAADCRLMVFKDLASAKALWVKGKNFGIAELLGSPERAALFGPAPSIAIFRLAPQDYHRFHTPVSGVFKEIINIPGEYYTVNPQAVNETLDVFTGNKRDVLLMDANLGGPAPTPVAFVAVGALLVASIGWMFKAGDSVNKGDNIGWFQYGGSTCITVFPTGTVQWDADLLVNSDKSLETLLKVGEHIGKVGPAPA